MNLKASITLFVTLSTALQLLYGQSSFLPKNLGPSVNSMVDEINPVLAPDGKTFYFIRVNHPENTHNTTESEDIWFCKLQPDGTWSQAQREPTLNISEFNSILSISPDGKTALVYGIFSKDGRTWRNRGLSIAPKTTTGWGIPQELEIPRLSSMIRGLKSSGMMSQDGKYIVLSFSRMQNGKRNNLYYCIRNEDGTYTQPMLIEALRTKQASDEAPFLAADNKTLYFSSDSEEEGQFDIYKSVRESDDWLTWSQPVKLNDTINSPGWDSYYRIVGNGSWAYYSSSETAIGGADIFKIKLYEDNPFVVLSGKILAAHNNQALIGRSIRLTINGIPRDSIHINADSATYSVRLPLGKQYNIGTNVKNYKSGSIPLDLTTMKEFTRMKKDLMVEPLPYVLVTGKLLDRGSNQVIGADVNPRITIDGIVQDSIKIDPNTGTYKVIVPYGKTYSVNFTANRFEPYPNTIDVTKETEYREIPLDLFVNHEKGAVITGKIIDKKTNKPLSKSTHVSIHVEGMTTVWATIDSIAGTYDLKLPLGANYTISAVASNYYPLYETVTIGKENTDIKIYKDLIIVPIEVGQTVRLNNIFFEVNKSKLKPESFAELDRVADFLKNNPEIKIEIGGHTDNVGKADANMKLSQARAAAVADYIISRGLPKENIVSKGYGLTKPVADNTTKAGKAQNRRVEFLILDK